MPCLDRFDPTIRWNLPKHDQSLFTMSFLSTMKANDLYFLSSEGGRKEEIFGLRLVSPMQRLTVSCAETGVSPAGLHLLSISCMLKALG